jgi:hypothetical protein
VRERDDHGAGASVRASVRLLEPGAEIAVEPEALDLRTREHGREAMDRVARVGHERHVPRLDEEPHQVRQTLLGADGRDRLSLGIELDAEAPPVEVADRAPEVRDAAARRVAVVARILRRLGELLDGNVRGRHVRVAEAEVDHVLAGASQLELDPLDLRERVGRQRSDPTEPDRGRPL